MDNVSILASSLSDESRCTIIMFYSKTCRLCKSVRGEAKKFIRGRIRNGSDGKKDSSVAGTGIDVIEVDADDHQWRPEAIQLGIQRVPCYVLFRRDGSAVCKTSQQATVSKATILSALHFLIGEADARI